MSPLRMGKISFTNVRPIYHFFDPEQFNGDVQMIPQVPAELNRGMANDTIDMGAISSFEYGLHHEKYVLLPELSVSSFGAVRSIFLFSRKPIEQLDGATIALTNLSATSVYLLKIILQRFYQVNPNYIVRPSSFTSMMEEADAALLIGDDALLASWNNSRYYQYDLGQLWNEQTGYGMVYAVWAVRKEVVQTKGDLLMNVHRMLLESKQRGLSHLQEVVVKTQQDFGGKETFWHEYFNGLSYDFTAEHRKGLAYYYACAQELGALPQVVNIQTWENK